MSLTLSIRIIMKNIKHIIFITFLSIFYFANSQTKIELNWRIEKIGLSKTLKTILSSDYSVIRNFGDNPVVSLSKKDNNFNTFYEAQISEMSFRVLTKEELLTINLNQIADYNVETIHTNSGMEAISILNIQPFRKNNNGSIEILTSFNLNWIPSQRKSELGRTNNAIIEFPDSSVLKNGNWYKIALTKEGIYKLSRQQLQTLGLDVNTLDPRNIRVYGNSGKNLPFNNAIQRPLDLEENSIFVEGEADGKFDVNDYVLFFGRSADKWEYIPGSNNANLNFNHFENYFHDTSFYYITVDLGLGKRVTSQNNNALVANKSVYAYDYLLSYEKNDNNVANTGREFYGEKFDNVRAYNFNFSIPESDPNDSTKIFVSAIGRDAVNSQFKLDINSNTSGSFPINSTVTSETLAPWGSAGSLLKKVPCTDNLTLVLTLQTSTAIGYLDKIIINSRRLLKLTGGQFDFRDVRSVGSGNTTEYFIEGNNALKVWDVSDPYNIKAMVLQSNANNYSFKNSSADLKQYLAFGDQGFLTPVFYGKKSNQNLHGVKQADYIIVCGSEFKSVAEKFAELHKKDSLTSVIATTQELYDEFSSGTPDIVGIRDFVRMLYKRNLATGKIPKQLFLLGDGAFNYKQIAGNTNTYLIPSYNSPNSLEIIGSYVTDDFFGILKDASGTNISDPIDVGIGRYPGNSVQECDDYYFKVAKYSEKSRDNTYGVGDPNKDCGTFGTWRNWVTLIGDDNDNKPGYVDQAHYKDIDDISKAEIENNYPQYNIEKIYLDAFEEVKNNGIERFPTVVDAINRRVEKGSLVMAYMGHGGEIGLSSEAVITVPQIQAWRNICKLPVFVTATCEFSRWDNPSLNSAGEICVQNAFGGAIGMFTTTRLVFTNGNFAITKRFFNKVFAFSNSKPQTLGEIYRNVKQAGNQDGNDLKFCFLGDPALTLNYPTNKIAITSINNKPVVFNTITDTMKALSKVNVRGEIRDVNNVKINNFDGFVYTEIFDKPTNFSNRVNNPTAPTVYNFTAQKNILFSGKTSVKNGQFEFEFVVPKDIQYFFDKGKISMYAENIVSDAGGYSKDFLVGGSNPNAALDNAGPAIRLYLNDTNFVNNGLTNQEPVLLARVADENGINTSGIGLGHDIVMKLDNVAEQSYTLNNYYLADSNTYKSGLVKYRVNALENGQHKLNLKVWDVYNNASDKDLEFIVANSEAAALSNVLNYPNPFTTKTSFYAEHNLCCRDLKVKVDIFTISGKLVKTLQKTEYTTAFKTDGLEWDGKDEFGDKLARGVYVYKVKISDDKGNKAEKFEKLVILN
jgi:hypothetical protein